MTCAQCLAGVEHWHAGGLHVEAIVHDDPEVVDPAIVANVDQGAALTAHVLTGWVDQYRAMIADGVDSTTALLSITLSVSDAANDGARGHDGLVSLVAVAVQQLARADVQMGVTDVMRSGGQTYDTPPRPQVSVPRPKPTPYTDAIAQAEADGYVFPPWIKTMVGKLESGEAKVVTNVPPQCTCATSDTAWMDCAAHPQPSRAPSDGERFLQGFVEEYGRRLAALGGAPPVITDTFDRPSSEAVEPWHGKAVETTYTSGPPQTDVVKGERFTVSRPRCSECYGVGGHGPSCSLDPQARL